MTNHATTYSAPSPAGEQAQAIRNNIKIAVAGLAGGLTLFLLGKWAWNSTVRKRLFNQSDDVDSPKNYATRINQAFSGLGTDEELLRTVIVAMPHKQFWEKVKRAYSALYGRSLIRDMKGELSSQAAREMELILSTKPQNQTEASQQNTAVSQKQIEAWAERIYQAAEYDWGFGFGGTDEAAMYQVFEEIPLVSVLPKIDTAYRKKYNMGLWEELVDELGWGELQIIFQKLKDKPDGKGKTDSQIAQIARG